MPTICIELRSGEILENDPKVDFNLSHIDDIRAWLDAMGFYKLYTPDGNIHSVRKSHVTRIYHKEE